MSQRAASLLGLSIGAVFWLQGCALIGHGMVPLQGLSANTAPNSTGPVGETFSTLCHCELQTFAAEQVPPWIPAYHVHLYTRLWRTVGAPLQPAPSSSIYSAYALCGSDHHEHPKRSLALRCHAVRR